MTLSTPWGILTTKTDLPAGQILPFWTLPFWIFLQALHL
jgi:hypothetical protein